MLRLLPLALSLAACGGGGGNNTTKDTTNPQNPGTTPDNNEETPGQNPASTYDLNRTTITVENPLITPSSSAKIILQLKDKANKNLSAGGDNVHIAVTAGTLSNIKDEGKGRYTASLSAKPSENISGVLVTAHIDNKSIADAVSIGIKLPTDMGLSKLARLGKMIYNDTNLSEPTGQSCNSCHDIDSRTFTDIREENLTSKGAKEILGSRNTPTASYAALIPEKYQRLNFPRGGQFWDGRAKSLEEQAKQPFLDPLEMANTSKSQVIDKIKARPYSNLFKQIFGTSSLENEDQAFEQVAKAITAFERTSIFSPFNAKFDAVKAGEESFTASETRGEKLFNNDGRCHTCHSTDKNKGPQVFSNFAYENIGTPSNPNLSFISDSTHPNYDPSFIDYASGSAPENVEDGPHSGDPTTGQGNGKFKVPTLRNIAKTAPYMHNGIFKNLREVIEFYDASFNFNDAGLDSQAEVTDGIADGGQYNNGLAFSEQDKQDLEAFLNTLTDR